MTQMLDVRHTLGELSERMGLAAEERKKAAVRSLNRTATTGRKDAARMLQALYPGLKVAELRKRIRLTRATLGSMAATLAFSPKRFTLLDNFGMREIRGRRNNFGVRFARPPWRVETVSGEPVTPEMMARAFRNRGRGGRASVFSRHTRVRTSHEVLVAVSIARTLVERRLGGSLLETMRRRFGVVFPQEAKFTLSKR